MRLEEIIRQLGGKLQYGDAEREIAGVADVDAAGELDLVFAEGEASAVRASQSPAGCIVTTEQFTPAAKGAPAVVIAKQPRLWFAQAATLLRGGLPQAGVHPRAVIDQDVELGEGVSIGACAVIGRRAKIARFTRIEAGAVIGEGVTIGEHSRIYPRAVIYPGTTLGSRVVVHAGAVLGADGFGYVRDRDTGAYTQFPQQGTLVLEDDVEIGANTTIDRGALRETRIRRGVKLDNLIHIGHNCDIGENVVMASLTGISGSSTVGKGAILAGQVGVGDHAHIGPGVVLGGQAGVLSGKTVTTLGTVLWGTPAKPLREYLRELATLARLTAASRRKSE